MKTVRERLKKFFEDFYLVLVLILTKLLGIFERRLRESDRR